MGAAQQRRQSVLLICRKRVNADPAFLDEISHGVEAEIREQLNSMLELDDESDPNFADADYQLTAYAAALRVLTERPIEETDPERELTRIRQRGETNPIEELIKGAVRIACDYLVPSGIDREMWKTLSPMERFYLKGLEVESHGEHRSGVYQELARATGNARTRTTIYAGRRRDEPPQLPSRQGLTTISPKMPHRRRKPLDFSPRARLCSGL